MLNLRPRRPMRTLRRSTKPKLPEEKHRESVSKSRRASAELHEAARFFASTGRWERLTDAADRMVSAARECEPTIAVILLALDEAIAFPKRERGSNEIPRLVANAVLDVELILRDWDDDSIRSAVLDVATHAPCREQHEMARRAELELRWLRDYDPDAPITAGDRAEAASRG